MMYVIGTRYNERKLMVFTTNFCNERQPPAEDTSKDRVERRLRSRLYEMCRTVEIVGEEYRRIIDAR